MIPRIFRVIFALMIASASLVSVQIQAEEPHAQASNKLVSFAEANNVNELYVAIMGEVDTPGTYRLDSSSLKLHHLIRCARGFTSDASKAIRIVRSGRVRQKEIFSEKSDSPLMPGDLLIVESRRLSFRSGKIASLDTVDAQTIRAGYEEGTIRAGIQIALVNVLDYPVVLRLRADQANASYLVQALGQPMSLLASTRIITPDVPGRLTSDAAKRAPRMEDGSVIVFERGKVNRNRLPVTLPVPYEGSLSHSSHARLAAIHADHSRDLRNLGQHPFWSNADPFDAAQDHRHEARLKSTQSQDDSPHILDVDQKIEVASELNDETDLEASNSQPFAPVTNVDSNRSGEDSHSTPLPIAVSTAVEQPTDSEPARFSIFPLLIVFLIVGAIAGLIVRINQSILRVMMSLSAPAKGTTATASLSAQGEAASERLLTGTPSPGDQATSYTADRDTNERMTIPIREVVEPPVNRLTTAPSTPVHPNTEADAEATPLARALLQLEQRRRA